LQDPEERQEVLGQQERQEHQVLLEVVDLADKVVQRVVQGPADLQEVLGQREHQVPLVAPDPLDKPVQRVVQGLVDPLVSQELLVLQVVRDRLGNQEQ
jgi:hypothetical protein